MARRAYSIQHHFKFWKRDGDYFTCEKLDLEAAIAAGGIPEATMRSRMGYGFDLLRKALQGMRLTQYEVQHVEHGIRELPESFISATTTSGPPC